MSAYSDAVLADSPLAYWRLGEASGTSCADSSGNGNTGTLSASMPPGGTASLLPADAADGSITFDHTTTLGPHHMDTTYSGVDTTPMTAEFWVKPVDLSPPTGVGMVVTCGYSGGWQIYYAGTTGVWHFVILGVSDHAFTAAAVAGVTQHIVFVSVSASAIDLYVNGAFSETWNPSSGISATTALTTIASQSTDHDHPLKAAIDEVALYLSALSAARIAAHYAAANVSPQAGLNFLRKGDRRS